MCIIEDCLHNPDKEICKTTYKNCKMEIDCTGKNQITSPLCCPSRLCDPYCVLNPTDKDCDPVDPPEKCKWGYVLGEVITELLIVPV